MLKNEEISPSDPNQNHLFSWSSKRFKCLSCNTKKAKKNQRKLLFYLFFFMFLANFCLLMASLTFSLISGIILVFLLVLGMFLIPSEWVSPIIINGPFKKPPPPEKRKYDTVGDWTPPDGCPDNCAARIGSYNSLIT